MRNRIVRFLVTSVIMISVVCAVIFSFMAVYMNKKSSETIEEVGNIYMSSMSEQISHHFGTTMSLRLSQVEALVETTPAGKSGDAALRQELVYNAKARGLEYLAFCSGDGQFEMLYGSHIKVTDPEPFLKSLNEGEMKIAVGSDVDGNVIVLMGVAARYPMQGGEESAALVAGLPVEYIQTTLGLDSEDSLVYSHIIRKDGSFVVRSFDAHRNNYFDRIREVCEPVNGVTPEQFVEKLSASMESGEDYSDILQTQERRRHIYCTLLPYSEWHLVAVMPYGSLDDSVSGLGHQWITMSLGGCGIILAVLFGVFIVYFRMTQQQMRDLVKAREEAEHAARAKSEFLSNMSHDIRTPMNAIVGMTAIATANLNNQQQVQNCLKKITLSSKHLLGLINDVLDMSKIESGKMTLNMDQLSLREVMESIVNIVQPQIRSKNQQFDVVIRDISVENVLCDGVRLNQILLNLLSNAIKFTPEYGKIGVSMYEEISDHGTDYVRIHILVRDSGIGMTPEFREKIFDSFSREDSARVRKTEGSGLGMAITKYIVDAMGGSIEVKSELGIGSEFHVVLDLQEATVREEDMILPDWNMLVVDDDRQLCESTVNALKAIGITADWVLSGEDALKAVEEHHKRRNDYHIVLLDWKLPGMDGVTTARKLRECLGEHVPILLISAYDWSEIEEDAKDAGISGFISKPLFKSTLFHGLKQYMDPDSLTVEKQEEEKAEFTDRRILLAEDNELNWEVAEELLKEMGLELDWAQNGQICVNMFRESPVGFYDAILMDLRMPVMNGYEATKEIRDLERADSSIPIIAMTADAFFDDIKKCLDCGMDAHTAKPINVQEIAHLLKRYMKKK